VTHFPPHPTPPGLVHQQGERRREGERLTPLRPYSGVSPCSFGHSSWIAEVLVPRLSHEECPQEVHKARENASPSPRANRGGGLDDRRRVPLNLIPSR